MSDFAPHEILSFNKKIYAEHFKDSDFGLLLASKVASENGYIDKPVRKLEGSSLVFSLGSDYFLKLTPPFLEDSLEAEISATKAIGDQLSFPIPQIASLGKVGNWEYLITHTVPGLQAKYVFREMTPENKIIFASDIGRIIKAFNSIDSTGFERRFGPWDFYLSNQLKNQRAIHLSRGSTHEWTDKICSFVERYSEILRSLSLAKLIHADLNHEHLMLNKIDADWRISGVIDLADAMNAPIEMEFVLPIICFFKGQPKYQQILLAEGGFNPSFKLNEYSNVMMALALQNRFIAFHEWFDCEIENGAESVDDVASAIFPAI